MKKVIIIAVALIFTIVALIGISSLIQSASQKDVTFTLTEGNYSVDIFLQGEENRINVVSESRTIGLEDGVYEYSVSGEEYNPERVAFTVGEDGADVTVDPNFSEARLNEVYSDEQASITSALEPYIRDQTRVSFANVYKKGDWAAAIIEYQIDPRELPDSYRVVLKKDGGTWSVVIPPTIAIQKSEYPEVPENIIYSLYDATVIN